MSRSVVQFQQDGSLSRDSEPSVESFEIGHVEDDVPDLFGYAHDSLLLQDVESIVHSAGPRRALLRVRRPLYHDRAVKTPSLTLTLDWNISSHQWLGVGSQLAAGVVGLIGCAKWMATEKDA